MKTLKEALIKRDRTYKYKEDPDIYLLLYTGGEKEFLELKNEFRDSMVLDKFGTVVFILDSNELSRAFKDLETEDCIVRRPKQFITKEELEKYINKLFAQDIIWDENFSRSSVEVLKKILK